MAGSFLCTPSASGRNPRQRARKNVSHTGSWQAHVPGRNEVLVIIPWDFPLRTRPLDRGWGWDQSLELQQQFERTRDSVSTGHLSYYRVSGVTLSRATHIWGHLVTPQADTLSSTKKGFRYNNPESSSECERCQAPRQQCCSQRNTCLCVLSLTSMCTLNHDPPPLK